MSDVEDKPIVVKGVRCKPNPELEETAGGGAFSAFVPISLASVSWETGVGGGDVSQATSIFTQDGDVVFRIEAYGIDIEIPRADWEAMTQEQRRVVVYELQNYQNSDRLQAAFAHYAKEGVTEIVIRYGPTGILHDGGTYTFRTYPNGTTDLGIASYAWVETDRSQTDLKPGSQMVITINSNHPAALIPEAFAKAIIHELLHAWVPDTPQPDGTWDDHDRLYTYQDEEFQKIFKGHPPASLPPGAEEGISFLGSRNNDSTSGTTANDIMAGMEGNDVLNGAGGNDVLVGGLGMDTLIAGSGFSDLRGGADADTYVASAADANFLAEDTGGVDRLVISGSASDFIVTRNGNNLSIWSNVQGYAYEIIDHFIDGKRIEVFQFTDAEYSASYLEYLAESGGGPGVCYQDGFPVICGQYGMPVVIDLDGDGVELVEANKSRVRWDVDGDGKAERVGWTNGDDAFLVLDRNGNGVIDSFGELSFLSDFRGAGSDLEGLLAYDVDRDGFLTAADPIFASLHLWQDGNSNGISEAHELRSLTDAGVLSISLEIVGLKKLDQSIRGNQVLGRSDVTLVDGTQLNAYDVGLYSKSRDDDWHPNQMMYSEGHSAMQPILPAEMAI
jgi:hypothetical protein